MNSLDVLDAPATPFGTDLVAGLRRASATIDHLWRVALDQGAGDTAIKLGEASQGVHRALIALSPLNASAA